jgi:hypothetical protein
MVEADVEAATGKSGEQDAGAVSPPAAPGPLPCLLDQGFHERLELVAIHETARARRTGRSGNAHKCSPHTVVLL